LSGVRDKLAQTTHPEAKRGDSCIEQQSEIRREIALQLPSSRTLSGTSQ
jgi:hypothetical protein